MKVRITAVTSISDGRGHRYRDDDIADIDDATAESWIAHGYCEPLDAPRANVPVEYPPAPDPVRSPKRKRKG